MNFKQLFLALSIVGVFAGVSQADTRIGNKRNVPQGPQGYLDARYGGANIATMSFTSSSKLIFSGSGVFQGIYCSSLPVNASAASYFATFHDTGTATGQAALPPSIDLKAYIHAATMTVTGVASDRARLEYSPPIPWVFGNGLAVKLNFGDVNMCSILYTKFD